jgi:hypothetical protein
LSLPDLARGTVRSLAAGPGRIAAAWAIAALLALGALGGGPGVSRDEAAVLAAASGAPSAAARPAPPLAAALARATYAATSAGVPHVRALRLGSALAGALLAALVALAAWAVAGPAGALLAPALFWLAPRHLHAGLVATPDVILAALALAAVLAWRRAAAAPSRTARLRAATLAGVLLGGALAARLDAWVLLPALGAHAALLAGLRRRGAAAAAPEALGVALAVVALVAAAVLVAVDPALLRAGLAPWRTAARGAIAAPLLPLLTLPATLLLAYAAGALHAALRAGRALGGRAPPSAADDALLLAAAVAALAGSALADVPPGARGALHAMPFLAILGARALLDASALAWPRRAAPLAAAVALLVLYPALRATARAWPQGASAWSELAGFAPGAASLGLPRQDGGDAVAAVLGEVNDRARPGARIWWPTTAPEALALYARDGRLRADLLLATGPEEADVAVVALEPGARDAEYRAWAALRTSRPAAGVYEDEVPVVLVYARAGAWR